MIRPPPRSTRTDTLFPYTTLFRSKWRFPVQVLPDIEYPKQGSGMVSDIDIGGRLRQVREKAGLSQRALARRAGITNSTISLIEANSMNPSVGALKRILDAIPLALADFFAFEPEVDRRPFFRASELVEIGKGAISYRQVGRTMRGDRKSTRLNSSH